MNFIEEYHHGIAAGKYTVSDKVRRLYAYLVEQLHDADSPYIFDRAKADKAILFIESFCRHSKGRFGGKPFLLELWEKAFIEAAFGFVSKETGLRRFREIILIVARKNGKSALGSAIALYLLFADGEPGAEIYSAATKRDQAKIIWNEAVKMVKKSPSLRKRSKCLVSEIRSSVNEGIFKPLASDSGSLDGLNVHGAFLDEVHAWKDKNLYDVIVDGETARTQPMTIITSTAGTVREGIYDQKYKECEDIINGWNDPEGYHDDKVLPIVYELDNRQEWTRPSCWGKANPSLDVIKDREELARKVARAKANPLLVKNLLTKDFNVRETSGEAFLSFEQLNNEAEFDPLTQEPRGRYGFGGFDLSATTDLTCATVIYRTSPEEPIIYVLQKYWIPEDLFEKRIHEDNVPYDVWHQRGLLDLSPGNKIDYRLITAWFNHVQDDYDILLYKIGYDSWSATYLVQEMREQFGEAVLDPVIQGKKTLSAPMHTLAAELEAKHINYNNNPILKWCMVNVAVDVDKNGNIQPTKQHNKKMRIDGFAALLDAFVVYERNLEDYNNLI